MRLPHDEGIHLSPLEWWYFNGHLTTESGQEFSYHFVTFQSVLDSGLTPRVVQLTWADHDNDLHLTGEQATLPLLEASSGHFYLSTNGWRMNGDGDTYQLSFQVGDYAVELGANSKKPAVLHHGTGLVDLGIGGKTYYYSRTDLKTSGTVSISGVSHPVTGVSWMDHQWGDFTTAEIGWDWLSLNLDDGSDLMVSVVWEQAGSKPITTYGTYVPPDSAPVHLPGEGISLDPMGAWTSAETGGVYPMGWELRIDSLALDVALTPVIEGSEFATSAFIPVVYWEGAVKAVGSRDGMAVSGKGFVEMAGYVPSSLEDLAASEIVPEEIETAARKLLADELDVDEVKFRLYSSEWMAWPDASLGCPKEGHAYAQVLTLGYKLVFDLAGTSYAVHTNFDGSHMVICRDVQ